MSGEGAGVEEKGTEYGVMNSMLSRYEFSYIPT